MKAHARPDLAQPDLLELLSLDEAGFKRRFAGTPMLRARRRGLLRNVCVALGNIGDERALPACRRRHRIPSLWSSEHARWAIEQMRRARRNARANATESAFQLVGRPGLGAIADFGPHGLDLFRRDGGGFVAPALADVGEDGGQVVIRQRGAHSRHGEVPLLALDLDRPG